jgi:hypothetical protein
VIIMAVLELQKLEVEEENIVALFSCSSCGAGSCTGVSN